ncbi:hypothetical protein E4U13_004072 [Claviceps humidiphila]|uniref:adenosine deaminase n=1 Tax=Claviceps humidiphila TaxID=1294629 RepID=A0A9P7PZ21_9HYPO|nr:hypothetical protein E4U13_004072 [Claviceps humidiphila]
MSLYQKVTQDGIDDKKAATIAVESQHADLATRGFAPSQNEPTNAMDPAGYFAARQIIVEDEKNLDFASRCRARASPSEKRVDAIVRGLRRQDQEQVYDAATPRQGPGNQKHKRSAGDHFLSNIDLIHRTALYDIASHMPKGGHLHIHYNACLPPRVLLDIAKGMDRMFITSNLPLVPDSEYTNYDRCELQFSITSREREVPGNLFSPEYRPRQTMRFDEFLREFTNHYGRVGPEEWLLEKLLFHEEEAHGVLQTAAGAWEKFNSRTRMMKGLFNYETAYRQYTRRCLEDFTRDNIQYAEIRPTFMKSNRLYKDDGTARIDNRGIMSIIIEEVTRFQHDVASKGGYFGGLKVIYTAPRSMSLEEVRQSLEECLRFKQEWPQWIAGYDLAGEESKGRPLKDFVKELLDFKKNCAEANVDIPFLFHCGETLDMGTDVDGNLVDALLLGAKRIGHGFALTKHPYIMQQMRRRGVCLELCPISNEVLGLTPRVAGHSMYALLANNVHCTISSDNGAFYRSTLSHDFYQVMIGRADMDLFGWKQLVLWSIEHACLDEADKKSMINEWQRLWIEFLDWAINKYDAAGTVGEL